MYDASMKGKPTSKKDAEQLLMSKHKRMKLSPMMQALTPIKAEDSIGRDKYVNIKDQWLLEKYIL